MWCLHYTVRRNWQTEPLRCETMCSDHVGRILKLVLLFKDLCRCKDHKHIQDTNLKFFPKRPSQTLPNVFAAWNIISLRWYQVKPARSTLISRGDTSLLVRPTPNNHAKQCIYNRETNSKFHEFEVISLYSRSYPTTRSTNQPSSATNESWASRFDLVSS